LSIAAEGATSTGFAVSSAVVDAPPGAAGDAGAAVGVADAAGRAACEHADIAPARTSDDIRAKAGVPDFTIPP